MRANQISLLLMIACLALSACAHHAPRRELAQFLQDRDLCDHFRGEIPDPPDALRANEVAESIEKYCTGTDEDLRALKSQYANDAEAMLQLSRYEDSIEVGDSNP